MPLSVNSNIPSINAQRNLGANAAGLAKALERLSSGLRINRAGDDAAGLAISESLRSQVRGLNQAVRNANDAVSLVATAEGAIQSYTGMVQRIRELAVQSANDTNSVNNRNAMQLEVDQLLEELSRIANTVQFNGLNLLDGTFVNRQIQAGAMAGQTINLTIDDMRAHVLGAVATLESGRVDTLAAGDLLVNGFALNASTSDGISYLNQTGSAIAVARSINQFTAETNVTAEVNENIVVADQGSDIQAIVMDGNTTTGSALIINGVNIGAVTVVAGDASGALVEAINLRSNQTGVTAELNFDGDLLLTAKDGRNVTVETTGSAGGALGFTANTLTNLSGGATTSMSAGAAIATGVLNNSITINGTAINLTGIATTAGGANAALLGAINAQIPTTGVTASLVNGRLALTSSDDSDVTVTTAGNLGITLGFAAAGNVTNLTSEYGTYSGTVQLYSMNAFSLSGTATGFSTQSVGVDNLTAIIHVDITTTEGATDAMRISDFALAQINEMRARLGAITNRLDATVSNLQIISENLAASDSRIRDADFASETANLTKFQILQQAGVAVLAQANVIPQAALQLLQ